jgi:hypothetical protein
MNLVEHQRSTIMKYSIQKNRFRSNLSSNGFEFGDFWSRTGYFKIPKDFFSLNGLYLQEESAIIFVFLSLFKLLFRSPQYESS